MMRCRQTPSTGPPSRKLGSQRCLNRRLLQSPPQPLPRCQLANLLAALTHPSSQRQQSPRPLHPLSYQR